MDSNMKISFEVCDDHVKAEADFYMAIIKRDQEIYKNRFRSLMIDIVRNNPGITVICPEINLLIKDIFYGTGTLISFKKSMDYYVTDDRWQNERYRVNHREFTLNIKKL